MVNALQKDLDIEDDMKKEVVEHLLFHKSIIDKDRDGQRINEYLTMIEDFERDEKNHSLSNDPFESAISSVFKLVIEEDMDPWDIDIGAFTQMYLDKLQEKEDVNFIVGGELINMAWSILKLQCERTLSEAEEDDEEETYEDEFIQQWDVIDYDMYDEPEELDYEEEVMSQDEPVLQKAVRREESKPVSLMDLVDAFENAKKEAKYKEKMERLRKENKKEMEEKRKKQKEDYDTNAHEADLQSDISQIWERICWYEKEEINFDMIHDGRLSDLVTAFVSVLFLNKKQKIKVKQEEYPDGPILFERLASRKNTEESILKLTQEEEDGLLLEEVEAI